MAAAAIAALGGELGDIAHDDQALARATLLATESAATFSPLLLRHRACLFLWRWTRVWAVVNNGELQIFKDESVEKPFRTLQVRECDCEVGEREECMMDNYCFRLQHATGMATFCSFNSKQLLLWLQALQASGVKYEEDASLAPGVTSLFQLRADLLSGEPIELSRYAGYVCLVVNAASK